MTIVPCPKCNDPVQMPSAAGRQARLQCPLCREEFLMAEVLDALPPVLEVLDDPDWAAANAIEPAVAATAFAELPEAGSEFTLEPAPAFSIDREASPGTSTAPAAGARRRKPSGRPQRKQKNAIWEGVKIALGGIAGLLIAQLLLWWMPWQDLRRDPFELGPSVAEYAPWMVPARFHGKPQGAAKSPADSETLPDAAARGPVAGADSSSLSDSGLPQREFAAGDDSGAALPAGDDQADSDDPAPAGVPDEESAELDAGPAPGPLDADLLSLPSADGVDMSAETDPDPIGPAADPAEEMDSDPAVGTDTESDPVVQDPATEAIEPVAPPGPLLKSPQISGDQLRAALEDARAAAQMWLAAEADDARALAGSYRSFAKLAEAATLADPASQAEQQQALQLLRSLMEDSARRARLATAGAAWVNAPPDRRDSNGVVLVGTVARVDREGDLYRTELALAGGRAPVAVYRDTDPADVYGADDQVLVVGAIIEEPAGNLAGFQGDASSVVWGPAAYAVSE